jgi:REP element-mobilizing transposase RayT
MPAIDTFFTYQRNMPHWRLKGSTYFVTWRLHPEQRILMELDRALVASAIKHFHGERYNLSGYVVMDDHCHAVVRPLGEFKLQAIMHSWKSYTARQFQLSSGRPCAIWQREYFDRIIRTEEEYWEKIQYMLNNPKKRWPETTSYEWAEWFVDDHQAK